MPTAAGVRRRLAWRDGLVAEVIAETKTARTLVFDLDASGGWDGHVAGQHVDVRLTAPDGYQATRSYSLSSGPNEAPQITVELVPDGEVSPHLVEVVEIGDDIELRGPVGGYFVWEPSDRPLLLVGGGSGIAPLRSIWRARRTSTPVSVLYSARTLDRVMFGAELAELAAADGAEVGVHLTRETHDEYRAGRIDDSTLAEALATNDGDGDVFVCGPTSFVESVSRDLVALDVDRRTIRTERFG